MKKNRTYTTPRCEVIEIETELMQAPTSWGYGDNNHSIIEGNPPTDDEYDPDAYSAKGNLWDYWD